MAGDMREEFDHMKQYGKANRAKHLKIVNDRFDELPEGTRKFTEWHWGIPTRSGCHIDYWPSKNKWQDPRSGRVMHGDFDSFKNWVEKQQ